MKKGFLMLISLLLLITAAAFLLHFIVPRNSTELENEQPTEPTSVSHSLIIHEHHKDNSGSGMSYSDIMEYMKKVYERPEISQLFLD